jgi:ubiquinone/menaquinone biosynthesis C-methylase UbiE
MAGQASCVDRVADGWWTLVAPVYDRSVGLVGWHRRRDALVAEVSGGGVLEVGCGPAHLAEGLMARGVDYVGLDRNAAMVARARRAIGRWGPGRGLVVRADVTAIPFPRRSFDVVVATGLLGLLTVPVRRAALREIVRVCRREVLLLEPLLGAGGVTRAARSRVVALVRERPLTLDELVEAGLEPEVRGRAVVAGVYSPVRATIADGRPSSRT